MENKSKKNSINSVIYLLLSAMLVCVVLISVFTVASRRRTSTEGKIPTTSDTPASTSVKNDVQKTPDTEQALRPTDTANTPAVQKPAETAPPEDTADTASASVDDSAPTSVDIRYFVIPTAGTVAKEFEIDIPVYSLTMNDYRAHTGVDIAAPIGTDVLSASSGTVCKIWNDKLMGRCVTVDHGDSIYTTYMNLSEDSAANLSVGDKVAMGQSIGAIGESALIEISEEPHLHLEMKVNGSYVDPLEYMGISSPQESIYAE